MSDYQELKRLAEAATNARWHEDDLGDALEFAPLDGEDQAFILAASPAVVFELIAENENLRADLEIFRSGGVPIDCNGSGCESCSYECHETDHIAGVRNMVKGPVGQIERWFCEGRDAIDGAVCRYGEHTLAKHWWARGYSRQLRMARAIVAEAQLSCEPDDFAIDHLNECLDKIDAAMSKADRSDG